MELGTKLSYLSGIGPYFARRLQLLDLFTLEDLINYYPFRYDDFSKNETVNNVKIGETVTLKGELWSIKNVYTRFRKILTQAILNDGTGTVEITWFNQPWLAKNLHTGDKIQVSGKVNRRGNKTTLVSPVWEKITLDIPQTIHTGKLIPVYSETAGITSKWIRQKIAHVLPMALNDLQDPLPESVKDNLLPLGKALQQIHFPENSQQAEAARDRLSFDELFYIQLATQKRKLAWQQKANLDSILFDRTKLKKFIDNLPFALTGAQKRVAEEILHDLERDHPMNRLVQGEVGSGKTVVAAIAAYAIYLTGKKVLLMAPTEILAFQHYATFQKLLEPLGIQLGIYTGSKKFTKKQGAASKQRGVTASGAPLSGRKELATEDIEWGASRQDPDNKAAQPSIIIGTHALLSKNLEVDNVGLVIVDEQQRFGVEQRSFLRSRAKIPHFLTMTATPIPRTVALTLYGDLDLSIIDEMPKGRKIVETHFVPDKKRSDAYKFIADKVKKGQQVYIITPLIEESETLQSVKAAKVEYEKLQKEVFPKFKLGLLHGRLKAKEKESVINDFKEHKSDILISTSVVEVGVDVPNATIMVIEGAERFGLAQLHQLRGRVGRGDMQSYAFLFTGQESWPVINRLKNLEHIHEGMKLAELDLQIRGAGEVFGTRQSGEWNLKIASLSDLALIEKTNQAAKKILQENPNLDKYPQIRAKLDAWGKEIYPD